MFYSNLLWLGKLLLLGSPYSPLHLGLFSVTLFLCCCCFFFYLRITKFHESLVDSQKYWIYSGTSLKRTLTGQKFLSALERCPLWRGLNWKVPKFKVRLFYTGPTLTRTPPPPYLTMRMWNGEKEVIIFVMYRFILHQRLK